MRGEQDTVMKGWMVNEVQSMKKMAWIAVLATVGAGASVWAQTPAESPATAEAHQTTEAQAPHPAAQANPFPPVNLKNFTADSPTTAEVNAFLKMIWGYDENRIWSVAGIQKTIAPGVARVLVFIADKTQPGKAGRIDLFITPDGKHAIAGDVMDFGANPFDTRRALLQEQADGPATGATGKELLLVEFGDPLSSKSKDAQENINNLVKEIPQARVVFESIPAEGSPYALHAAEEGVCVRKAKGDAAFFTYAQAVYSKLTGLTAATLEPVLSDAVTAAGADPKAVATCAALPETKANVEASIALAGRAGITSAPALVVNGRILPPESVSYDTLKRIVAYQSQLDGVAVHVQPTLSNLK